MTCACAQTLSPLKIDGAVRTLYPDFDVIGSSDWTLLLRCPLCAQLWKMNEYDKYQTQLAMKVSTVEDLYLSDATQRKAYLLTSRGGIGTETCRWINCPNIQLKNSAYCVDHLYATGARE